MVFTNSSMFSRSSCALGQALVAEAAVEVFDVGVLHRLAWLVDADKLYPPEAAASAEALLRYYAITLLRYYAITLLRVA